MPTRTHGFVVFLLLLLGLAACAGKPKPNLTLEQAEVDYDLLLNLPAAPISYAEQVRPILERRCVVCHGCYDAPCQLKLSSFEGLDRGANPLKVYDGARILPAQPTRLFIDAKNSAEWRDLGFHPVLADTAATPEQGLEGSLLYRMLRLKQRHPQPRVGMLPNTVTLELDREQECTTVEGFDDFAQRHPLWGMPYGMPNLGDDEYRTLVQWLAQGAQAPEPVAPSRAAASQIERWEQFLNGRSKKQRLVSRYLYEHLFQAHLHFANAPPREFYRLVRSSTPPGQAVDEIARVRPYDDPGESFYYRLRLYHPSVVAKDHVVYELSDRRMARYRELFLEPDYEVAELPPYTPDVASNPFKVYQPIPPNSRYRFLLDDARFFVEGFIKGPVCRGQVALNVIDDHFWVFFFAPDTDIVALNPDFLNEMQDYLQLPADRESHLRLLTIWNDYWVRQSKYMRAKADYFRKVHAMDLPTALNFVWNGDGNNPNAALTVFRHFDSASVTFGLTGDYPDTAWIIDYPMFERIHYLLVAGFDVYGNLGHQLNTRLYMDFLRMEGEDHLLAFLPAQARAPIRASWYQGPRQGAGEMFSGDLNWLEVESVIGYRSDNPLREFFGYLERHLGSLAGDDRLNRCPTQPCRDPNTGTAAARADAALRAITRIRGDHLRVFPDVSFLRVRTGSKQPDLAYSLILNKGYKNLTSIFDDEDNRDLDDDTLTVLGWLEGSYPNFFFVVDLERIEEFVERYQAIRTRDDYERFVALFGIRRTNQGFWEQADWFHQQYAREQPVLAGLFDLNRYRNR